MAYKESTKDKHVFMRMHPEQHKLLKQLSDERDTSISEVLRGWVLPHLKAEAAKRSEG